MHPYIWNSFGFLALLAGLIGVFLPVFPTVPFTILAAFCFTKGSQRFHDWLIKHPVFGPPILDWRERRAVPRYAKYLTTVMLSISLPLSAYMLGANLWWVSVSVIAVCLIVLIWLWRLPDA